MFHRNKPPFEEISRVITKKDHFEAGILVADTRHEEGDGCLFAAMFTSNSVKQPCKIVKLTEQKQEESSAGATWKKLKEVTPSFDYTGQLFSSPVVDSNSRILVTGTTVSGNGESGRGYIAGYNVVILLPTINFIILNL